MATTAFILKDKRKAASHLKELKKRLALLEAGGYGVLTDTVQMVNDLEVKEA